MDKDKEWLQGKIFEFMVVIEECLSSTTFAVDRNIYTNDLAEAAKWVINLYKGVSLKQLCEDILSNQTSKFFGDYWRQGPWGEKEAIALSTLREEIKARFKFKK
jgi:hypothetical protein